MDDLLVLCYHGLSETWPEETAVRPSEFARQLEALQQRGYRGATLSEALCSPVQGRVLVVTFDDAHRSVLELAAPVMDRMGIPGTVFVPTDYAAGDTPMGWAGYDVWLGTEHEDELRCLAWEDLRGLVAAGWEVGSHTRTHPRLSRIDDAAIAAELAESKRACEEGLRGPCESLAYPYSDYDARAVRAAREAGYRLAVTVPTRPASPTPLEWPRVVVGRRDTTRRILMRARARRLGPSLSARLALASRRIGR
jgi:peptidoglycan/xylan/chitin deacetylase (PgdA/CDA1 family)